MNAIIRGKATSYLRLFPSRAPSGSTAVAHCFCCELVLSANGSVLATPDALEPAFDTWTMPSNNPPSSELFCFFRAFFSQLSSSVPVGDATGTLLPFTNTGNKLLPGMHSRHTLSVVRHASFLLHVFSLIPCPFLPEPPNLKIFGCIHR